MRRWRGLICGLAILFGSCSLPEPPLRVGLLLWPPYELTVLAHEQGWYPEGSVRILEYHSPLQLSRAFRSGQVDVALTTSHISLSMAHDGVDHRIIYIVDHSQGGDALVARPDLTSLQALAGQSVGVEPSPLGMYVFHRLLDHAGLEPAEVNVVPLDIPQQQSAYRQGRADAVLTYEPVRSRLLSDGARELFNSREIPYEIIDVVIAREPMLETHHQQLEALIAGMDRALAYLRESPDEALPIMATRAAMDKDEFRLALDGAHLLDMAENREWMQAEPSPLVEALEIQMQHMLAIGMLGHPVDVKALVDARFVRNKGSR